MHKIFSKLQDYIAPAFRAHRVARGFTKTELAEQLRATGLNAADAKFIRIVENGNCDLSLGQFQQYCKALGSKPLAVLRSAAVEMNHDGTRHKERQEALEMIAEEEQKA